MIQFRLALVALVFSPLAHSADSINWQPLKYPNRSAGVFYLDPASVLGETKRRAVIVLNESAQHFSDPNRTRPFRSTLLTLVGDCAAKKLGTAKREYFLDQFARGQRTAIDLDDIDPDLFDVGNNPLSMNSQMLGSICTASSTGALPDLPEFKSQARNKAQALADLRRQAEMEMEALYANGPSIFDVRLGSRFSDVTDCGNHQRGKDFNPMNINVPATCYESSDQTLRFPPKEQPGWVSGNVRLDLDKDRVVGMNFMASDAARAIQTIDSRFGAHRTAETPMHLDATQWCNAYGCRPGHPERNWIQVIHTWETEKASINARGEKGKPELAIYIDFKSAAQARKVREQMEAELGREAREKAESRQEKF